jgi:hypothetical protein
MRGQSGIFQDGNNSLSIFVPKGSICVVSRQDLSIVDDVLSQDSNEVPFGMKRAKKAPDIGTKGDRSVYRNLVKDIEQTWTLDERHVKRPTLILQPQHACVVFIDE